MNKSTRILFLLIALAVASFVSYVVYQKTGIQQPLLTDDKKQETVQIAVAQKSLDRGDKITVQDVRMASYLRETLPKGHFTDLTNAVDRIVVQQIEPTEPLLESSLAPTELTKGGLAAIINPQKRAMAVKVNDVIGVAGFLHPGHLVDVLVSLQKPGEKRTQVTKTVLENILVLSVGTQADETADKKSKKVTVVTLEVDLDEGEKLALAVNQGSIQLALRGYADTDQILTRGTNVTTLLKSYATASNEPVKVSKTKVTVPKKQVIQKEIVVEVMNGDDQKMIKLQPF